MNREWNTIPFKLQPNKNYPQVHNQFLSWTHGIESGVNDNSTIVPTISYDEATSPTTIETHPENAAFAEVDSSNCHPDSRIDNINRDITFNLTKAAIETDKVVAIKCAIMEIHTSFEDQAATDELSSQTIATILELQQESTDRQAFPLYNTIKMDEKFTNSSLMDAAQDGLTSTQKLEAVTFSANNYYDALHFMTISHKLKTCTSGLKWFTLDKLHPTRRFRIGINPKSKRVNQFTFNGILVHVPPAGHFQYPTVGDTTDIQHVSVTYRHRYNEWNLQFNSLKV